MDDLNKLLQELEIKQKLIKTDNNENLLLSVKNLNTYFPVYKGIFKRIYSWNKAVENVSFDIKKGEILSIVGESGCGKSTVARSITRLYKPVKGEVNLFNTINFNNNINTYIIDLLQLNKHEYKAFRSDIQMIFQDPYSSLNPRFTVYDIIKEPLLIHKKKEKSKHKDIIFSLLNKVGLSNEQAYRYPHEFSGGQRQRIGIARALSTNPRIIIADEPVSALDVSIQAQIINLMQDLQKEFSISFIFIAHDLAVVKHISHKIAIMYLGKIMEIGPSDIVYQNPKHPYTVVLLSAIPNVDINKRKKRILLKGEVPSSLQKPSGCVFHTRCPIAAEICKIKDPDYIDIDGVKVKCFFPGKL